MRILFWNLKNNSNEKWISNLISSNNIDVAIFAEYKNTSFEAVKNSLNGKFNQYDGLGACEKVTLICKETIIINVKREQSRYTLYSCLCDDIIYNIVGVHLPAPPSANSNDRKNVIRDLVQDICELEKKEKNNNTIIVGDFNCNPFDEEVIQKDSFNAVLFKELIENKEEIIYYNRRYKRFYNPILDFISEQTGTYGSFYYSSESAPLYWNSFDQVLVRKELANNIQSIDYVKQIGGKSLLKDVKPNAEISDHLPLLVDFMKGEL